MKNQPRRFRFASSALAPLTTGVGAWFLTTGVGAWLSACAPAGEPVVDGSADARVIAVDSAVTNDDVPPVCAGDACVATGHCIAGRASAQFRRQTAPPDTMTPGTRAHVSVTFDNCSGQTWTASGFALLAVSADGSSPWGIQQVPMPGDVADGDEVTIAFDVIAPSTTGTYRFGWAIARPGQSTLQEPSTPVNVDVRSQADCTALGAPSRYLTQNPPSQFVPAGGRVTGTVTFSNCSTETWTTTDGFALGSQDPTNNSTWGTRRIALPNDVAPGTEVTIPISVTAPTTPGNYRYAWQIVRDGTTARWIGDVSPSVTLTALRAADCSSSGPPARFVRQSPPGTLVPNQSVNVSASFSNCSDDVWTRGGYHLDGVSAGGEALWRTTAPSLPFNVGPGFSIDIPFTVRAPAVHGTYAYRWAIAQDGHAAMSEATPAYSVTVRCVPACGGHNCGGDGCGGSCGSCGAGSSCSGGTCTSPTVPCGQLQWWNSYITWEHVSYGWHDTDLGVAAGTRIQLRHRSRLLHHGVYGWGYMPEFLDLVTGDRFRFLHLKPQYQWATTVGREYPAGYVVGLSGGNTYDTGYPTYSSGSHLCVQTLATWRSAFPSGHDTCH